MGEAVANHFEKAPRLLASLDTGRPVHSHPASPSSLPVSCRDPQACWDSHAPHGSAHSSYMKLGSVSATDGNCVFSICEIKHTVLLDSSWICLTWKADWAIELSWLKLGWLCARGNFLRWQKYKDSFQVVCKSCRQLCKSHSGKNYWFDSFTQVKVRKWMFQNFFFSHFHWKVTSKLME